MTETTLTDLKAKITGEYQKLDLSVRKTLAHVKALGEYLGECSKLAAAHGVGFKAWVKAEFAGRFSYATARGWMTVAEQWHTFTEDELVGLTYQGFLKEVADRRRYDEPALQTIPAIAIPPFTPPALSPPVTEPVAPMPPVPPGATVDLGTQPTIRTTPADITTVGIVPPAAPPVVPAPGDDDRIAAVARDLDLPADKLREALVRLGYLAP